MTLTATSSLRTKGCCLRQHDGLQILRTAFGLHQNQSRFFVQLVHMHDAGHGFDGNERLACRSAAADTPSLGQRWTRSTRDLILSSEVKELARRIYLSDQWGTPARWVMWKPA